MVSNNSIFSLLGKLIGKDRQYGLILKSNLFDGDFYTSRYVDVQINGFHPLTHFLKSGGVEGRWPNPLFHSDYYLSSYPEVREAGINPLVHYVLEGDAQGY